MSIRQPNPQYHSRYVLRCRAEVNLVRLQYKHRIVDDPRTFHQCPVVVKIGRELESKKTVVHWKNFPVLLRHPQSTKIVCSLFWRDMMSEEFPNDAMFYLLLELVEKEQWLVQDELYEED